jgi:hypothetical protein
MDLCPIRPTETKLPRDVYIAIEYSDPVFWVGRSYLHGLVTGSKSELLGELGEEGGAVYTAVLDRVLPCPGASHAFEETAVEGGLYAVSIIRYSINPGDHATFLPISFIQFRLSDRTGYIDNGQCTVVERLSGNGTAVDYSDSSISMEKEG